MKPFSLILHLHIFSQVRKSSKVNPTLLLSVNVSYLATLAVFLMLTSSRHIETQRKQFDSQVTLRQTS